MYHITDAQLDNLFSKSEGSTEHVYPLTNPTIAKLVYAKRRDRDSLGEYFEGDSDIYVILEIDGTYFKKTGRQSSYGFEIIWDAGLKPVEPIVKTIKVWE